MKPNSILKKKAGQSSNEDPNKVVRSRRLSVWLTDEEYSKLEKNYETSRHNSLAAFAREVITSTQKAEDKYSDILVQNLIQELKKFDFHANKIGVNINQIARNLNLRKNENLTPEMAKDLKKCSQSLEEIESHLAKLASAFSSINHG